MYELHRSTSQYWCQVMIMVTLIAGCVVTNSIYTKPACHKGIMSLFHWCEQSECKNNCTCLSLKHVCKQICNQKKCEKLFCSSPQTCYQSALVELRRSIPTINIMASHTPISQQDCSQAKCKLMKALRYDNVLSRSFQSCSEGTCDHVHSTADEAKQFCGNCKKMTCQGKHSKTCTQLCVLGKCEQIVCNSKVCTQVCSHRSTCNMTCGPNTKHCEQTCSHGSSCVMNCKGKSCKQICNGAKSCEKHALNSSVILDTTTPAPANTQPVTTAVEETTVPIVTTTPSEEEEEEEVEENNSDGFQPEKPNTGNEIEFDNNVVHARRRTIKRDTVYISASATISTAASRPATLLFTAVVAVLISCSILMLQT